MSSQTCYRRYPTHLSNPDSGEPGLQQLLPSWVQAMQFFHHFCCYGRTTLRLCNAKEGERLNIPCHWQGSKVPVLQHSIFLQEKCNIAMQSQHDFATILLYLNHNPAGEFPFLSLVPAIFNSSKPKKPIMSLSPTGCFIKKENMGPECYD